MQLLNNITDAADQLMTVPLADGSNVQIELFYRPGTLEWSANIAHPLLDLKGMVLTIGPNLLRQWKNLIPFGLAVTSNNGLMPMQPQDFSGGTCRLYILNAEEVDQVEQTILAPIPLVNP